MQKILLLIIIFMINNIPSEAQNKKSTANNTPLKSAALSKIAARHIGPAAMSWTCNSHCRRKQRPPYYVCRCGRWWRVENHHGRLAV